MKEGKKMATRSRIAVKVRDIYRSIYCHWDGYPSNQFPILTEHYATQEAAELLPILLGARCELDAEIVKTRGALLRLVTA